MTTNPFSPLSRAFVWCVLLVALATPPAYAKRAGAGLVTPKLFAELPDYCPTPDGMAIHPDGDLVVACPNFADQTKPACLLRIDKQHKISKWIDVPVLSKTGLASPMGLAFGPDGDLYVVDNQGWKGTEKGKEQGRMLRLRIKDNKVLATTVIAEGMEHPNGVRVRGDYLYVTQSLMTKVKDPSGLLVSALYRFRLDDKNIKVTNTLEDKNIVAKFLTQNKDCQYGVDGLVFDSKGNLFVGNFGDGSVSKLTFNAEGGVASNAIFAKDAKELRTTDGMCVDSKDNIYIADFSENAVVRVSPDSKVKRLAKSPDSTGANGELDQPGEPIVWNDQLVVSCFDLVTGPDKVNTKHDKPYTLSVLPLGK